jgi:hypothetical protein
VQAEAVQAAVEAREEGEERGSGRRGLRSQAAGRVGVGDDDDDAALPRAKR